MSCRTSRVARFLLASSAGISLVASASAVTIGAGVGTLTLPGANNQVDTPSNGTNDQSRQNIDLSFPTTLEAGTYQAVTWSYNAGQAGSVIPYLAFRLTDDPRAYEVLAAGAKVDISDGFDTDVLDVTFGGTDIFTLTSMTTVYAGIVNPTGAGVQNPIRTNLASGGIMDHDNNADGMLSPAVVGGTVGGFGFSNLGRSYAFSIEVISIEDPKPGPPALLSLNPADGATEVPVGSNLVARFDEPIAIGSGNVTIKNLTDSTQVAIPVGDESQVSVSGITLTIDPIVFLDPSKNYAVQIDATAIEDTTGDNFAGILDDVTWRFSTTAPDLIAPTISNLNPANGATDVALESNLIATFDEPVTIGSGNITIKNLTDSTQVAIPVDDAQVSVTGDLLTIDLVTDLLLSKNYAIQIDATALEDLAGNGFAGIADDTTWAFTTPVPASGAVTIGPGSDITDAVENDTPDQDRLNIDRAFTKLEAGTYDVADWVLNVVMSSSGSGEVTPMLLTGPPPIYTVIWLGSPFDPTVDGIQTVAETGDFTLTEATDVYAGFFTTNQGSEIIGTDTNNSGTGSSSTDHDNDFIAPIAIGETVEGFSHAALGRTYAFEINVEQGAQAGMRITEIKYIDGESPVVEFTFTSRPDRTYKIEASSSMLAAGVVPGGWVELDDGYESQGTETSYTDDLSVVSGPRVFYRVQENPRE